MEALAKMGINSWLLILQAINFLVLLFILHRYAYRPLLAFLDERSLKIQKGIEDAQEAQKMILEASEKQAEVLAQAQREAKKILENADEQAKKRLESAISLAEAQSEKIVADARAQSQQDTVKMLADAKKELSSLVISTVEKVIGQKLDASTDADLIKKLVS